MSVLPICHLPDDLVLRRRAKKVFSIDKSIQQLIDNMIDTMHSANGVGLAAPQVGVSLRIVVVQMPEQEPIALINPEIIKREGEQNVTEGCLSVPGYYGEIKRSGKVIVKGKDRRGKTIRIKATGLMAEAFEHELDHLNGVLYIDHIESTDRLYRTQPSLLDNKNIDRSNIV